MAFHTNCNVLKTGVMLKAMPAAEPEVDAVRRQLERVLGSAGFSRNERLGRFLRFIVERHLEGRDAEIKESVIAVEVFGRPADYDSKQSSIVRTEAARLRARLGEYYAGEGQADDLIIELPKGGYVPVLRQPTNEAVLVAHPAIPEAPRSRGARAKILLICAVSAAGVGTFGWWWSHRAHTPITVGVLPLTSLSPDASNDYFADALTDELIRKLSIIEGLGVRSQTSSFALKGKSRNLRDAAKQLNVDYILEGSVLRSVQQLRINAQLVRVKDDFPLWSGQYSEEVADVLKIQDEISRGIVNSLRLTLGQGRRRYETSVEAYDLYLRARAFPLQLGLAGYARSIEPFEQAIAKDPSLAPAYAGLAAAHAARSGTFRSDHADELVRMRVAAEKAIQLDPLLAEAHNALGMVYARGAQWDLAEKSFRRQEHPATSANASGPHHRYGCAQRDRRAAVRGRV